MYVYMYVYCTRLYAKFRPLFTRCFCKKERKNSNLIARRVRSQDPRSERRAASSILFACSRPRRPLRNACFPTRHTRYACTHSPSVLLPKASSLLLLFPQTPVLTSSARDPSTPRNNDSSVPFRMFLCGAAHGFRAIANCTAKQRSQRYDPATSLFN